MSQQNTIQLALTTLSGEDEFLLAAGHSLLLLTSGLALMGYKLVPQSREHPAPQRLPGCPIACA
jgi:transketolase